MNITKQKQTHSYGEQSSGYHWEEGRERGNIGVRDKGVQNTMYKINKIQGYIAQHRQYSQYVIITLNVV